MVVVPHIVLYQLIHNNQNGPVNLSINQKNHNKYSSAIDFYKPNEVNELNKKDLNLPKVKIVDNKKLMNISLDDINQKNNSDINNCEEFQDIAIQPKV